MSETSASASGTEFNLFGYEHLDFTQLLTKSVSYKEIYSHICGGDGVAGLYLSQLIYWNEVMREKYPERKGWFFKQQEDSAIELGLTRKQIIRVEKVLVELRILQKVKMPPQKGGRPISWIRLNVCVLNKLLFDYLNSQQHLKKQEQKQSIKERDKKVLKNIEQVPWDHPGYPEYSEDFYSKNVRRAEDCSEAPEKTENTSVDLDSPTSPKRELLYEFPKGTSFLQRIQTKKINSKPAEAFFDFDLVFAWILAQLENSGCFTLDEIDKAFVSAKLEEYQERYRKPNKGDALSYVDVAMRQRHGIECRSMKAGAARDKLNNSVIGQLEAQAAVIDQHTKSMRPQTLEEKLNDRSWAEAWV